MALTILQSDIYRNGTVFEKTVVETYARQSEILRVLPFQTINGNAYEYPVMDKLPGVEFRRVNQPFTESTGTMRPERESLKISGGTIDVDRFLVVANGEEERSIQEQLKLTALAHHWSHNFINGDETVDDRQFNGLKKRISGGQLIGASNNATTAGGTALKLSDIDRLLRTVPGANYLIMNAETRDLITQGTRSAGVGGNIQYTLDDFGRSVTTFGGIPILISGQNNVDLDIIPNNESNPFATNDTTNTSTSIYAVNIGSSGLSGIQNGEPVVLDLGLVHPWYRSVVEWFTAIVLKTPKAAGRLAGIKTNAAVQPG